MFCNGSWVTQQWPMTHLTHPILVTHSTHWPMTHCQLCARVNHHTVVMPCEVTVLCTQLITHVAFEWLFAGVRPHMSFPGHLKIHAGVKPCACSACDYRRSQKWNLDSRMQSVWETIRLWWVWWKVPIDRTWQSCDELCTVLMSNIPGIRGEGSQLSAYLQLNIIEWTRLDEVQFTLECSMVSGWRVWTEIEHTDIICWPSWSPLTDDQLLLLSYITKSQWWFDRMLISVQEYLNISPSRMQQNNSVVSVQSTMNMFPSSPIEK